MGYIGNSNPSVTNLGGDIDVNGHQIKSSNNGNIEIVPDGSGTVKIDVLTFPVSDGSNGQFLQTNGSGVLSFSTPSGGITSVAADSTPQLGGNLDVNGNDIVSTSNGNIEILPNGSGKVHLDGNGSSGGVLVSDGLIEIKTGTGSVGEVRFYCESSNAHYVSLKSPAHSSYSGNVVLTLPATDGSSGEYLKTDGNGVLSWDTPSGGGGGGSSSAVFTVTVASAPSNPSSGQALIYSTQTSGHTGIAVHSGDTSEVFKVYYHTNTTPRLYINNSGNAEFYGYVGATYYNPRSGSSGGNFQPMAGYGEGSGLELPGAIIMTGSSAYSQYAKPIKMYGKSNAYVNLRPSTSQAAGTNFDFILPAAVGSSGQYLKTTGSGVTEWASVSAGTPNPVDIPDSSSDQPTSNCIRVGTGNDMRIFHYNGKNYIRIATNGSFGGGGDFMIQDSYGQAMVDCIAQGHVKLTHNGSNKLTTAYGGANSITLSGVYTLPGSDGSSGQQLTTNGSGTVTFAAASSDERLKKDISANDMGLSFINELNTKVYTFKSYKELDASDSQLSHLKPQEYTKDGDDSTPESVKNETEDDIPYNLSTRKGEQRGLLAQEVKTSLDKLGIKNFKVWGEDKYGVQEIHLEEFVVPLIKAVQELSKRVEELEKG